MVCCGRCFERCGIIRLDDPARAIRGRDSGAPAGNAARGETWFWAGGCASCHAADKAEGPERFDLGGGRTLKTEFGDFVAPNISSDRSDGIGGWSSGEFANAMLRGVSPEGSHPIRRFPIRPSPG